MTTFAKQLTESKLFRVFIVSVILLAGVLAGLETSAALMADHGGLFRALDWAVLTIFVVEITLKIVAHGRRLFEYFRDGWNVFDFVIVALCFVPASESFGAVLRLARVLRLLRLVTALPKLQLLVGALLKSLSAMGYVSLLLSLLFYIYAVAGVHLFGKSDIDFGSLGTALLTLFRIVTLDSWGEIYDRAVLHAPAIKVAIYFVTFIVFGTMIILNLFIGIILSSMSEMHAEIEERDRKKHIKETGSATLDDNLSLLERELQSLQEKVHHLRRKATAKEARRQP